MTDSEPDPLLCDLAQTAARTSDAAAEMLGSLGELARGIRAAHAAGVSLADTGRMLWQGRAQARGRRALARIKPSIRLALHAAEVIAAAAANGLTDVQVFGSCARGEANLGSDVDLIVAISSATSLIHINRFAVAVEDLLGLDEGRVDVLTGDALRPGSDSGARIAAEAQPLQAWAAGWQRLDSLQGWAAAHAAGASESELVEAAEYGLHPSGETTTQLRIRPAGRPAGATLVDPGEVDQVSEVLDRYAAARAGGLDHDEAITRAVTTHRPV